MAALANPNHGEDLMACLTDLHGSGHFADVKLVCIDGALWSHRPLLAAVSPVLKHLLLECVNDDVVTLIMPHLRRKHLKLVLDYVYRGSMTLRARQMAHVIGVIEVLHLKCGVSVSKRNDSACDWVEEAEFDDFSDKALNDLCHFKFYKSEPPSPPTKLDPSPHLFVGVGVSFPNMTSVSTFHNNGGEDKMKPSTIPPGHGVVPKLSHGDFEEGEPVEVRPVHSDALKKPVLNESCSVVEVEAETESDDDAEEMGDLQEESDATEKDDHPGLLAGRSSSTAVKCIMCGKEFQHQANLRVHIQSHLGSRAQLKSCEQCDRNFRSTTEHDLHMKGHEYARLIGKKLNLTRYKKVKEKSRLCRRAVRKAIRTLATKSSRGNLYRKYVKKILRHQKQLLKKELEKKQLQQRKETGVKSKSPELPHSSAPPSGKVKLKIKVDPSKYKKSPQRKQSMLAPLLKPTSPPKAREEDVYRCPYCPKVFSIRSSFLRHSREQHGVSKKRKMPATSRASRKRPKLTLSISSKKSKPKAEAKAKANNHSHFGSPSTSFSDGGQSPHPGTSKIRKSVEQDLTCPTCDKVFLAKSIFERHLKTYKHGRYEGYEGTSRTPSYIPEGGTDHMNLVLQPTMEVGGREVNKYECHLCNQVFLRVKDLAKHRQRMCTAWQN